MVDSTEIPFELTAQEEYELTQTVYNQYFQTIPQNPNVFQTESIYSDVNLTQVSEQIKPNQDFSITGVAINERKELVYQLDNTHYILASKQLLFDDTIVTESTVEQTYWLKQGFTVLSSPISNQAKELKTDLRAYQAITISKIATTAIGDFAYISDRGWISLKDFIRKRQ